MSIGAGVVLLVLGLILVLDVLTLDLAFVRDDVLGWILLGAGLLTIVLSLSVLRRGDRVAADGEVVEERRTRRR